MPYKSSSLAARNKSMHGQLDSLILKPAIGWIARLLCARKRRCRRGLALLLLITRVAGGTFSDHSLWAADSDPAEGVNVHEQSPYSKRSPFNADEFLSSVASLINEHDGYVSKERFEQHFDIRFAHFRTDPDGSTSYWLVNRKDWYFYAEVSTSPHSHSAPPGSLDSVTPDSRFSIGWDRDAFGDPTKGECITVAHVRELFTRTGWVVPEGWGDHDNYKKSVDPRCAQTDSPCAPWPAPLAVDRVAYIRKSKSQMYPEIKVDSDGNRTQSCVTGFVVRTRKSNK